LKKTLSLLTMALLLLVWKGLGAAEPLGSTPTWSAGTRWTVYAVYRRIDGGWTDPVAWRFEVDNLSDEVIELTVTGNAAHSARLIFQQPTLQLQRAVLSDEVRGKAVVKQVDFDGPAPAYPLVSPIPFHTPLFAASGGSNYQLVRKLNGRPLPSETLEQQVREVNCDDATAGWPDAAHTAWQSLTSLTDCLRVQVHKQGRLVFEQVWLRDLPWAIYTGAENVQAWLAR